MPRLFPLRPRSATGLASAAFLMLAGLAGAQAAPGAPAFTGIWSAQGADCGGASCTREQMQVGAFQRWTMSVKLRVAGTRVCGLYESSGAQQYSYLLVGELRDGVVYAATGQETSADPAFFDRDDYARVPAFRTGRLLRLARAHARLRVQVLHDHAAPAPRQWALARIASGTRSRAGGPFYPSLPWEEQFLAACLAHGNAAIEAAARPLRALAEAPPGRP